MGGDLEKGSEGRDLADDLLGDDLLLQIGCGVGAQELDTVGLAGEVEESRQAAEAERLKGCEGAGQLSVGEREHGI